jgi:VanZ family protein
VETACQQRSDHHMKESAPPFLEIDKHPKRSVVTDIKFLRAGAKICCVPIVALLVIAALGPAKWAPRTELGWQFDHIVGYFGITLFFCFAWPRPIVVGGIFMAAAALLEGLQALTPDRSPYLPAALYGVSGALAAAFVAELFIRAWRWHLNSARDAKSNL